MASRRRRFATTAAASTPGWRSTPRRPAGRSRPYWQPDHPVQRRRWRPSRQSTGVPADRDRDRAPMAAVSPPSRFRCAAGARLCPSGRPLQVEDAAARRRAAPHPRRDDGPPRAGRRRAPAPRHRADARAPRRFVAKGGAEGVEAVALLPGAAAAAETGAIGLALKIEDGDGARRAGPPPAAPPSRSWAFWMPMPSRASPTTPRRPSSTRGGGVRNGARGIHPRVTADLGTPCPAGVRPGAGAPPFGTHRAGKAREPSRHGSGGSQGRWT